LELVISKVGDGTEDKDDDGKGEVFSLSASVVWGNGRSWIAGDMMEGISSSDEDGVEQMEETALLSSRGSPFEANAEGGDADGV
jgi:hypothetical protein